MIEMRKFTRNDWMSWSGAVETERSPAMIQTLNFAGIEGDIILDDMGLHVYFYTKDYDIREIYALHTPWTIGFQIARGLLNSTFSEVIITLTEFTKIG